MNKQELLEKWGEPQVVDNEGFVRLIDYMGDDNAIPQAARVSYGAGTKTVLEDAQLIRFLMRNEHFSPFAMCQVKLHLRLPIYVHNQFVRHDRFHWNVMSARYSEMPNEKWCPDSTEVRGQGKGNKQVGNGEMDYDARNIAANTINAQNIGSQVVYQSLLDQGVCREQARTVLPMGQYTESYVTANLGDWLLFLKARLSPHAQLEIRVFANAIYNIFCDLFPVTMKAFKDYQLEGVKFSAQEMETLKAMLSGEWLSSDVMTTNTEDVAEDYERLSPDGWEMAGGKNSTVWIKPQSVETISPEHRKEILSLHIPTKRERQEFWKKIT